MKILQVHNYYQQRGGEDSVVAAEKQLLSEQGHAIISYYKENSSIVTSGKGFSAIIKLISTAMGTIWNGQSYREIKAILKKEKPDIVHCHNIFPLISPAVYWACFREKIPVIQTIHNYRLFCLNATFCRTTGPGCGLEICEQCLNRSFKWPGIRYKCYRNSLLGSFTIACMLFIHRIIGTWTKKVSGYIALTEFQKKKLIEGGIPSEKVFVKPNFLQQNLENFNDFRTDVETEKQYVLFVGRLSKEKGCDVLIRAWAELKTRTAENCTRLLIAGDGPCLDELNVLAEKLGVSGSISFLGSRKKDEINTLMRSARFLAFPSIWYEGFPMVILEAFSADIPVVASETGGLPSIIEDGITGFLFPLGNFRALAEKMETLLLNDDLLRRFKRDIAVRKEKFSSEKNYKMMMTIYSQILKSNA